MGTNSEGGHSNNVAIAEKVLDLLKSWGENYTPPTTRLTLTEVEPLVVSSRAALNQIQAADTPYHLAVNKRQSMMEELVRRSSSAFMLVKVLGTKDFLAEVKTIYKSITGKSKVSRQSVESRIANFELLIERIKTLENYAPTEENLTIAAMEQLATDIRAAEAEVARLEKVLEKVRTERDKLLYTEKTGLMHCMRDIKTYIEAAYKRHSPEYKALSSLMRGMRVQTVKA